MAFLTQLAAFVVLLGSLVFVHELGHFLAAKYFHVKVLRFSLGFGPRIWGFRRGETEYQLAALPLGGYVRMAGEDPNQPLAPEDKGRGFAEQSPLRRAVIAFAGPFVNLIVPPLVFFALNLAPHKEMPAVVGFVLPGEPADVAGVKPGDRIVSVDGEPTRSFDEMREVVEKRFGRPVDLVVERKGEKLTLHATPASELEKNPIENVQKGKIGIVVGKMPSYVGVKTGSRAYEAGLRTFDRISKVNGRSVSTAIELDDALQASAGGPLDLDVVRTPATKLKTAPLSTAQVLSFHVPAGQGELGLDRPDLYLRDVEEGSKAWEAGLRPGDKIVAFAGAPVTSSPRLMKLLEDNKEGPVQLTVERGAERVEVAWQPPIVERDDPYLGPQKVPDFGFSPHPAVLTSEPFTDAEMVSISYPPLRALSRGVDQSLAITRGMVLGIAGLITGHVPRRSIGGPLTMFSLAGAASERGLADFLKLCALISINLGLVNLLPVPILDGFHIVVSGIEGISRRAVPLRVREVANYVGLALLLMLMVLSFWNDFVRLRM